MGGWMAGAAVFMAGLVVTSVNWMWIVRGRCRRPVVAGVVGGTGGGLVGWGIVQVFAGTVPTALSLQVVKWSVALLVGLFIGVELWFAARFALEGRRDR